MPTTRLGALPYSSLIPLLLAPFRFPDLTDRQPPIDIPIQHPLDQFDIRIAHNPRYA